MYVYDDVIDHRIRKYIGSKLMTEHEFLKKNHIHVGMLSRCRKDKVISRPMVVLLAMEWVDFSWINFELYEWDE